jgi:hypothetical protein
MKQQSTLNSILALTLIHLIFGQIQAQINWQSGGDRVEWANACDFLGNDMDSARVPSEKCGDKCLSTNGCSHFAWTNYQGGTCWMKSGGAQKSDAIFNNNHQMLCGVTSKIISCWNPANGTQIICPLQTSFCQVNLLKNFAWSKNKNNFELLK